MLRTVRAGMLAVSSRVAARLPHLSKHDVAEIDQEIRIVLTELGTTADEHEELCPREMHCLR